MTEDEIYRTSTQYRLWSFTPETLASLRKTTNAVAADGVRAAYRSLNARASQESSVEKRDGPPEEHVDCLTLEEEQKIISYYCGCTLDFVDLCEYPTNVKVGARTMWDRPVYSMSSTDKSNLSCRRQLCNTLSDST